MLIQVGECKYLICLNRFLSCLAVIKSMVKGSMTKKDDVVTYMCGFPSPGSY